MPEEQLMMLFVKRAARLRKEAEMLSKPPGTTPSGAQPTRVSAAQLFKNMGMKIFRKTKKKET